MDESLINQVVKGIISDISADIISIELTDEISGEIQASELGEKSFKIGDTLDVYVEDIQGTTATISHERALLLKAWDRLYDAYESKAFVSGTIAKKLAGNLGFGINFDGVLTHLPGSTLTPEMQQQLIVGSTDTFMVTKFDRSMGEIEVSLVR